MNGIVHYALVAFWGKSGSRIIADYPADKDYRAIALGIINSLKTIEDDRISVSQGKLTRSTFILWLDQSFSDILYIQDKAITSSIWNISATFKDIKILYTVHVLLGELHYACLTSRSDCPSSAIWLESCSQIFLQRLRSVYREVPILADLSRDLTHFAAADLSKPLKKLIKEYNQDIDRQNVNPRSLIPKLEEELGEVRRILMDAVQKLIDRGEKMDELVRKTQSLEISSKDFHVVSRVPRKKKSVLVATGTAILMIVSTSLLGVLMYIGIL
ncbi:uncharacterized protein LOC109859882 isoform X1 [Pseudomyrmex gracilis]|uniref:uncharacterized protein LOC109859882 isoform X1 n=1 Tax=Pseudomyrmex gracilis TaxID=219809 RepID=UPI000994EDC9|nr:uncharacterized protein LOC109859882 isoform X1 [Pseudomyrmex gracilis]